jgi:hypothetical protein
MGRGDQLVPFAVVAVSAHAAVLFRVLDAQIIISYLLDVSDAAAASGDDDVWV